ncbi:MAG: hypothetical protein AAF581_18060 [Planctomycetota bacterium]
MRVTTASHRSRVRPSRPWRRFAAALCIAAWPVVAAFGQASQPDAQSLEDSPSRLSDEAIPLQVDKVPERTPPIFELGNPFLGTGVISPGFRIPTGAVWNPALQVFGSARSAVQIFDDGTTERSSEWANRLDLFANLQLTHTERILIGWRPLDDGRDFTSYVWKPDRLDGWREDFDTEIEQLFFEGDFGELFPMLDLSDTKRLDLGFAVGRQLLRLQGGYLANDVVDGFGITRNSLRPLGFSNLRWTAFVAWEDLHRGNGVEDDSATFLAFLSEADIEETTIGLDLAWTISSDRGEDAIYFGASAVRRWGALNVTLRLNGSMPIDDDGAFVSTGLLPVCELSWTPHGGDDVVYVTGFWGIDEFTSAVRAPDAGGALAPVGILFEAAGLGRFGSALDGDAESVAGGVLGYQVFLGSPRRQLLMELGGRFSTDTDVDSQGAIGARFQQALGERILLQPNVFGTIREGGDEGYGARFEVQVKF